MSKEASHPAETISPKAKWSLDDLEHEAAVMSPSEAAWLAWYMCALSFAFTALGLLLLVLSRAHPGVPVDVISTGPSRDAVIRIVLGPRVHAIRLSA